MYNEVPILQITSWWLLLPGSFPSVALIWVNEAATVKGLNTVK